MYSAAQLFADVWNCEVEKIAIENPVMHKHARAHLEEQGVPAFAQSIQPWQFGEPAFKRTCLWLRGLPALRATEVLEVPKAGTAEHKAWSGVHRASPGPERWKDRSRTYEGIARAMADQWGRG